jgi:hypothetical protein
MGWVRVGAGKSIPGVPVSISIFDPIVELFSRKASGSMPTSIDPPPADDEIECARCGAHFFYELTRCPNCGVNLYEPDDEIGTGPLQASSPKVARQGGIFTRLDGFLRRLTKRPYTADELFGTSIDQAGLFDALLTKVGGDRPSAERLIEFERWEAPQGNRIMWLENAIRRWERDNRGAGGG